MFINKKAVKLYAKEKGKQTSDDFYIALEGKVKGLIERAIRAANHHKRLKASELL